MERERQAKQKRERERGWGGGRLQLHCGYVNCKSKGLHYVTGNTGTVFKKVIVCSVFCSLPSDLSVFSSLSFDPFTCMHSYSNTKNCL